MTPDQIVEGLTEAQRRVLVQCPETVDGRVLVPTFLGNLNHSQGWPAGIIEYYSAYYAKLTPLGLAIRDHLQGGARG